MNDNILNNLEVVQKVCLRAAVYFLALGATVASMAVFGAYVVGLI
jgi:hypothetical protein